jgi:integrase
MLDKGNGTEVSSSAEALITATSRDSTEGGNLEEETNTRQNGIEGTCVMGSLFYRKQKMKDGTYRELPTIWLQYRQHGKLMRESSGSTKERVARRMLRSREGDVEHGIPIVPTRDRITFDDAAEDMLNDYRTNGKRSLKVCERRVKKHLAPFFKGRLLANMTTSDIRAYTAKRQADEIIVRKARVVNHADGRREEMPAVTKPVSNGEINRELTTLKRMFSLAVQADKLTRKPHIPMLQERNTRVGFFEPEQLAAALAHLPEEIQPVIQFAAITGWRIASEILGLEWRQIDMAAGEVKLDPHSTKNGEARTFPFTAELRALLQAREAERDRLKKAGHLCPHVFFREVAAGRGGDKKPRRIISFTKAWQSACRKAGCPGRLPHDLRRTAVRSLVRAGVPERVAMQLTGHKTRSVFERYNIVSGGDLRDAAARLDAARGDHKNDHTSASKTPAASLTRQIS